jgi:hypothetical protein
MMLYRLGLILLCLFSWTAPSRAAPGHYLFVFTGDQAKQGNDFLAVIDADPASASYGHLLTSVVTDQKSVRPHHTEYVMPQGGMLFANDHDADRTIIFDLRDPLHPKVAASFTDVAGFAMPHSFVRLPNGNVLATFQHVAGAEHHPGMAMGGGLVEIDDSGKAVRSAGNVDPAYPNALMMPYSLAVLPGIDRVLTTNSSMHSEDIAGTTVQLWRLSDLKLIKTAYLDIGADLFGHINPEEARVGPDGAVYVQTLACGIERVTGLANGPLRSKLVHLFPGDNCGVPTIVGHYLVQSVPAIHGYVVLDIANGDRPKEVSRLTISDTYAPHWTAWDPRSRRMVVTSGQRGDRTYLLKLDEASGALTIDEAFRGDDGQPGFSFASRRWPHGWTGEGQPHGAVFSR